MVKNRVAWVSGYLPSAKSDDGAIITFAAALTIFMGYGAIRMMSSSSAPADAEVGSWLPADNFSQGARVMPRSPATNGRYLLSAETTEAKKAASAVQDAVSPLVPTKGGFTPMVDAAVGGLVSKGIGGSDVANGSPGTAAQAQAKAAAAKGTPIGADIRNGESRPFVSTRVIHTAAGSKFRQAAVGGVPGGASFGGSSAGSSFDVVSGPTAGTNGGVGGALNMGSGDSEGSLGGSSPGAPGGLNNMSMVGGGAASSPFGDSGPRAASAGEIAGKQQLLSSDDQSLRQSVALPAVQLLSSMIQSISNAGDPRSLEFVVRRLESQGLNTSTQFNPQVAQVDTLLSAAVPCLQELSQESDLPEDPQGALLCHVQAGTSLQAYDSWPGEMTGANQVLGAILKNNPPWSYVSARAGGSATGWAQTTHNVADDVKNLVFWAHTVKLPSWEPGWEQNLDEALQHLQTAALTWDQLANTTTADATRGTLLAFGSRESTAGLASLDRALLAMGGNNCTKQNDSGGVEFGANCR